eukprot:SAG11_NODE_1674_length_4478_cov_2.341631_2_plen_80_part_00
MGGSKFSSTSPGENRSLSYQRAAPEKLFLEVILNFLELQEADTSDVPELYSDLVWIGVVLSVTMDLGISVLGFVNLNHA